MKKFYWLAAFFTIMVILFTGCMTLPTPAKMVKAPEVTEQTMQDVNAEDIVLKLLPKEGKLIAPKNPKGTGPVQVVDIDEDGKDEIFATYRINGVKLEVVAVLLKENNGAWVEQWKISSPGYEFGRVEFANLTDLKQKELIIGADSTGGPISSRGVKIFIMEADKPREIYSTLYEDMEVIHSDTVNSGDKKDGLALWFKYGPFSSTVESYKLERLDNEYILMPDSESNQYFIKNILPQYEAKMDMLTSIRDSWKYFYCYADIMLMIDEPALALGAIENGLDRADTGGDRAKIKLLLLKAKAYNAIGNSERAAEVLQDALSAIKSLGEDEYAAGFEALLYLELANTFNAMKDEGNAGLYYEKAVEAGKKACNERAYESAAQSDNPPFYAHYLKVDSIEKDFKEKFIYSLEER